MTTWNIFFIRITYFCQAFVFGTFGVYLNPLLSSHGVTASQLGLASFLANSVGTFSRILCGIVADRTKKHHVVMFWLSINSALVILAFGYLPRTWNNLFEGRMYQNGTFVSEYIWKGKMPSEANPVVCWPMYLRNCHPNLTNTALPTGFNLDTTASKTNKAIFQADKLPSKPSVNLSPAKWLPVELICSHVGPNHSKSCDELNNQVPARAAITTVIVVLLLRCLFNGLFTPTTNLLDSITHTTLGEQDAYLYGRSRVFASLGFAVAVAICGFLLSHFNGPSQPYATFLSVASTSQHFGLTILLGSIFAVVAALSAGMVRVSVAAHDMEIFHVVNLAFRSDIMLRCICASFFAGILFAFNEYFFLICTEQFGIEPYFLGILTTANIFFAEIPGFLVSDRVLTYFGENICLSFSFLVFALQNLVVALTRNYFWLLFSATFLGVWFPLIYHTLLHQATRAGRTAHFSLDVVASMHALMNAILFGVSAAIGGLFWGILLEYVSGIQMFYLAFAVALGSALLVPVLCSLISRYVGVQDKLTSLL